MLPLELAGPKLDPVAWQMIDGLCMMWAVTHSPDLLLMPDGRSRLFWRKK
jgi:hypothetical protein